ncbi:hypothetical protein THRCLA_07052, partial [Thraustotheca clavata]
MLVAILTPTILAAANMVGPTSSDGVLILVNLANPAHVDCPGIQSRWLAGTYFCGSPKPPGPTSDFSGELKSIPPPTADDNLSSKSAWDQECRTSSRNRIIPVLEKPQHHSPSKAMVGRDPKEPHRKSTPLEKLYDLTLVVALSAVSDSFADSMKYGDNIIENCLQFIMLFYTIWNAWLPYVWFASSYDVDDIYYRVGTLGQMVGILVIADGIRNKLSEVFIGYIILRLFLEAFLRGRAAYQDVERRWLNIKLSITSISLLIGWGFLFHTDMEHDEFIILYFCLGFIEYISPMVIILTSPVSTRYHAHHIAERYTEFTIIVFGECLLSLSHATVIDVTASNFSSLAIMTESLVLLFMLWWFYSLLPFEHFMEADPRTGLRIGRGHLFIHGALAAFATGLYMIARCGSDSSTDHNSHDSYSTTNTTTPIISTQTASMMVAVPVALFITSLPIVTGLTPATWLKVGAFGFVEILIETMTPDDVVDPTERSNIPDLVPKTAEPAWAVEPHDKYKVYPLKSTPTLNHPFHKRMVGRDPKEKHRTSTPLEKLFDLTLVVALSAVSDAFATMMQYGDNIFQNFINFTMLFFAIWDAWLPFIWFATTYDVDDVLYRIGAWGQMIGILVVTDGIRNGLSEVIFGYV